MTARTPLWPVFGWSLLDVALGISLALGFSLVLGLALALLQSMGFDIGQRSAALGGLPVIFIPLSLIGTLTAGVALWVLHRQRLPALPRRPWRATLVLAVLGLALGLQVVAVGFTMLTETLGVDTKGSNLRVIVDAFETAPFATLLAAAVLAPLGEELAFRRVLLHRFAQAGRPWLGLAATSLLFALIHEPTPGTRPLVAWGMTLGIYALLGVGFGLLYLRSGRLDAVVLAHVLVNASGLYLLLANPF